MPWWRRAQGDEPGVPPRLIRYQFSIHLGSAGLELDGQGQITSYEEYSPTATRLIKRREARPRRRSDMVTLARSETRITVSITMGRGAMRHGWEGGRVATLFGKKTFISTR